MPRAGAWWRSRSTARIARIGARSSRRPAHHRRRAADEDALRRLTAGRRARRTLAVPARRHGGREGLASGDRLDRRRERVARRLRLLLRLHLAALSVHRLPVRPRDASQHPVRSRRRSPSTPTQYETTQLFATSKDGTRIPFFVTHRKGLALDGTNPTILYAYGGFAVTLVPTYSTAAIAWMEQGGVWVTASLRGGGEYGEAWHQAGMRERKQNVFDDYIAVAEQLIADRYTSPAHLAIQGGSNGGLLVGAAMTQRPELFAVALPAVGVLDMLRYHRFTGGAGVGHRVRLGRGCRCPALAPRVFAAAQRQGGALLPGHADHHRRPRRPRRPVTLVQVRRHAPGRAGVRAPDPHPRRDARAPTATARPTS